MEIVDTHLAHTRCVLSAPRAQLDNDPVHPILADPWTWQLVEFTYHYEIADWRDSYIDMAFTDGEAFRRLRFFAPQDLRISGFPSAVGMTILDVRHHQLEGIGVRVDCFEQSSNTPTFWASHVVELDEVK